MPAVIQSQLQRQAIAAAQEHAVQHVSQHRVGLFRARHADAHRFGAHKELARLPVQRRVHGQFLAADAGTVGIDAFERQPVRLAHEVGDEGRFRLTVEFARRPTAPGG
ncbi:hypothetical protein G6F62_013191 [Rhizopus arrhizus]|nr:hypothetical protein G6F62_013191 [Rhizopus arrhizus]